MDKKEQRALEKIVDMDKLDELEIDRTFVLKMYYKYQKDFEDRDFDEIVDEILDESELRNLHDLIENHRKQIEVLQNLKKGVLEHRLKEKME